ncbi:MAG TPA: DUF4913 domain-containing protein [Candidatus Limnocylindrales bacterium]
MANLQVTRITRESVVLEWDFSDQATAYMVSRLGPRGVEGVEPEDRALAACYEGTFCDHTLTPGSRYTYTVRMIANREIENPDDDVDEIHVRAQPATEFADARAFLTGFLSTTFPRHQDEHVRWCEEWWRHPEAAYVVEQLWCAYEALRPLDPPAFPGKHRAEWLVVFLYPLMDRLTHEQGPFAGCYGPNDDVGGLRHQAPMKQQPLPHIADPTGEYRPG